MHNIPLRRLRQISDDIPLKLFEIEALPAKAFASFPNRHDFYEIFWITGGQGSHFIDFVEYGIRPNTLFVVKKGAIHYWALIQPLQGFVLHFQPNVLFATDNRDYISRSNLLHRASRLPAIYPSLDEVGRLHETWERLNHEYNQPGFARTHAILALMQLLLVEIARIALVGPEGLLVHTPRSKLAYQYKKLVEEKAVNQYKVERYADDLGVTLAHLSVCVKEATGMTASEILRRQRVLEAKRLLVYASGTVPAVAQALHFADASYFARFFKRETGQTPRQFQNQFLA